MLSEKAVRYLLNELFKGRTSVFFVVTGFKEIGKTSFVLWLMEKLHEYGYFKYFGGNHLTLDNINFDYTVITDLQTLKRHCLSLNKKFFFFFDEIGKAMPKAVPWRKLTLEMIQDLEVIRMYKLTVGGCAIGDVDRRILSPSHLDFYIKKIDLKTAKLYHFRKRYEAMIRGIPMTSVKYDEYLVAKFTNEPLTPNFKIDRDWEAALSWARKEPYQGEL